MASLTKAGVTTNYAYNADGIRTQKTVGSVVHNYILDGSRILADYMSDGTLIKFAYDQNNVPVSFTVVSGNTSVKYNYVTDLQGDVMEIRDASNNIVGSYVYNAFGKIISKSGAVADINPLRYRGYYFDAETGFYYLNSRYYDPQIGRFINADGGVSTDNFLGYNLFSYCNNNPVNFTDPDGTMPKWLQTTLDVAEIVVVTAVIVAAVIIAAPAVAAVAGATALYMGASAAVAGVVTTAATISCATIAGGVAITGLNRAVEAASGTNLGAKAMGEKTYSAVESTVNMAAMVIMAIPPSAGYPSTGRTQPNNLEEEMSLNAAMKNPDLGQPITGMKMNDVRMPAWMGWQKLQQTTLAESGNFQIHYVGHKIIPFYFDFKIKY